MISPTGWVDTTQHETYHSRNMTIGAPSVDLLWAVPAHTVLVGSR